MKKIRKIMNVISIMILSVFLVIFGVMAALNQGIDIGGKITTTVTDHSGQTRVQVKAYARSGFERDYALYGEKTAWNEAASFIVPDITIEESEPYLIHKLEFINYGEAISLTIAVTAEENFVENFDYYIDKSEISDLAGKIINTGFEDEMFLQAGLDYPKNGEMYILIMLKNSPEENGIFSAYYTIRIELGISEEPIQGYTIRYNANGGTGIMETDFIEPKTSYTVKDNGFTNPDMYFMGWALNENGDAIYIKNMVINVEEDLTLYAIWRGITSENLFTYTVEGELATITKYIGTDKHIVIPTTIDGYNVREVAVTSSLLPINTEIVTAVMLAGLSSIGSFVFNGCGKLISVTIPNSVISIGNDALNLCPSLTNIEVASDNPNYSSSDGVLFNKNLTELIQYPGGKHGEYSIPSSVISIGYAAFNSCENLTSVIISNSVTSIGASAFFRCKSLSSITISSSVISIGTNAFNSCPVLFSITIPSSVNSIGTAAFSNCLSLENINVVPGNLNYSSLSGVLFNSNMTELIQYPGGKSGNYNIPASVIKIGASAFYSASLTSMIIPNSVASIDNFAFRYCSLLKTVYIQRTVAQGITTIGINVFASTHADLKIYVPAESLEEYKSAYNWSLYASKIFGQ